MPKNVLLVLSKQETALRSEIEDTLSDLTDVTGKSVLVHASKTHRDALTRDADLEMHFAIIGHALAADGRSPVEGDGGIGLCVALRNGGREYPIVLLLPHVTVLTNSL